MAKQITEENEKGQIIPHSIRYMLGGVLLIIIAFRIFLFLT